ncbi:hypothetical protein [Sphingobium sp. UBA5915]|uniref:hypothetical protein n=1 Tax=Sphingobium sp. UBA5915 TaxID=1947530 RepID=UPI0025F153B6|nr:hypothetical protein [Sphingobium sp. UBA5915]
MVEILPFAQTIQPRSGHRVDVHDFIRIWVVVVWRGRAVLSQREFPERRDAEAYAQQRARELECSLIHHPTCAGGGSH